MSLKLRGDLWPLGVNGGERDDRWRRGEINTPVDSDCNGHLQTAEPLHLNRRTSAFYQDKEIEWLAENRLMFLWLGICLIEVEFKHLVTPTPLLESLLIVRLVLCSISK